jgi:REP element-mobilizing transposase RayT
MWIHVVFATKDRFPLIQPVVEKQIHDHMREQLIESGCLVRIINGMPDHVHLLFLQNPKTAVTDIIKQVKGNTSHWVNGQNLMKDKFAWQTGYAAYSVSESQAEKVFQYIKNQKEHHSEKTFLQEYEEFMELHGLQKQNE